MVLAVVKHVGLEKCTDALKPNTRYHKKEYRRTGTTWHLECVISNKCKHFDHYQCYCVNKHFTSLQILLKVMAYEYL